MDMGDMLSWPVESDLFSFFSFFSAKLSLHISCWAHSHWIHVVSMIFLESVLIHFATWLISQETADCTPEVELLLSSHTSSWANCFKPHRSFRSTPNTSSQFRTVTSLHNNESFWEHSSVQSVSTKMYLFWDNYSKKTHRQAATCRNDQ